jgi:hypothetical protein
VGGGFFAGFAFFARETFFAPFAMVGHRACCWLLEACDYKLATDGCGYPPHFLPALRPCGEAGPNVLASAVTSSLPVIVSRSARLCDSSCLRSSCQLS